jgi:hypothetical protein
MISRNRSTCGVRPYVRGSTNPDASSWVKRFLAPWVDRKYPDPAQSGELRYFLRISGEIIWARTPEELKARYGQDQLPKSVTFVRASIFDNKIGMAKDPEYLGNLQAQTPVERARLLDGDWDVKNDGLVYPDFGTCVVEPELWPAELVGTPYGGIDWGFNNPFGALAGVLDGDDVLWVWWERYGSRITLTEHSKALADATPRGIRWWADPAGADQIAEFRRANHDVVPAVHSRPAGASGSSGARDKILESEIALVSARIRSRRLRIKGTLGNLLDEAGKYHYDGQTERPVDADNHLLAALRYLVMGLDRGRAVQDQRPPESEAEVKARATVEAAAAAEVQAEKSAKWHNEDNDAWWH